MQGQGDVDNVARTIWRVVRLRLSQGKSASSLARRTTVTLAQEVSSPTTIECVHLVSPSLPLGMGQHTRRQYRHVWCTSSLPANCNIRRRGISKHFWSSEERVQAGFLTPPRRHRVLCRHLASAYT